MEIQTERLVLRPFEDKDFEDTRQIYTNPKVCKFLLEEPWTEGEARNKFQNKLEKASLTKESGYSIAVDYNGKVIGSMAIWYTEMRDTLEIGYVFSPNYGGRGLATEAVRAVLEYAFNELDVHRVQANLDARNAASEKLCRRVGMRKEAHFIQDFWSKGEWTDSFVFGMLRSDLN
ncbi:ribosomal-protein-serine acetyltransferase [Listeria floridensis FSL S10-1187]|uniref:Ribosomal-protein-serine acetyltransferase n=1 Tax=Listeria floridensis FSL S10-1187 TaxID=1265817 RepID=A0ABN0RDG0_9LIST|nr:GNAT family N-acetyltransferase [Listeria floridensis]EUJ28849.1 ribosomal-protein-serine acetyltransferase [Listeria floridensis FSL S10-1187]